MCFQVFSLTVEGLEKVKNLEEGQVFVLCFVVLNPLDGLLTWLVLVLKLTAEAQRG